VEALPLHIPLLQMSVRGFWEALDRVHVSVLRYIYI
jgi:hypothetical protein